MNADGKNSWSITFYVPEKSEFLYQYLLVDETKDADSEQRVLWEGALERRVKLGEASSTPKKSILLIDNTKDEQSAAETSLAEPTPKIERIASADLGSFSELAELREHADALEVERSRCANELQKLQDVIGFALDDKSYKERDSFVPDAGPLYEKVKEIQAIVRRRYVFVRGCHP